MSFWAGAASGGLSALGGIAGNVSAAREAKKQRKFAKHMYKHRYRYSVEDMRAAGINPLLAVQGGMSVGGAPQGSAAAQANPAAALGAATGAGGGLGKQKEEAKSRRELRSYEKQLLASQATSAQAAAQNQRAQALSAREQTRISAAQAQLLEQEAAWSAQNPIVREQGFVAKNMPKTPLGLSQTLGVGASKLLQQWYRDYQNDQLGNKSRYRADRRK